MPVSHIRRPRLGELVAPWPRSPSYGMTALASEPRSVRMPLPPAPGAPFTPPRVGFCRTCSSLPSPPGAPAGSARGARRTVVPGERRLLVLL